MNWTDKHLYVEYNEIFNNPVIISDSIVKDQFIIIFIYCIRGLFFLISPPYVRFNVMHTSVARCQEHSVFILLLPFCSVGLHRTIVLFFQIHEMLINENKMWRREYNFHEVFLNICGLY